METVDKAFDCQHVPHVFNSDKSTSFVWHNASFWIHEQNTVLLTNRMHWTGNVLISLLVSAPFVKIKELISEILMNDDLLIKIEIWQ